MPKKLSTSPRPDSHEIYEGEAESESSGSHDNLVNEDPNPAEQEAGEEDSEEEKDKNGDDELVQGMDPAGFSAPAEKIVKPLTPEALAAFKAAQERTGVVYISRIPPGMRPSKVRHLMSQCGEIGRVYLQQEDPKRAYLRRKYTATKKVHFTEGWVEFKDKKIARSVAEMLNAQPIGGKKGSRWHDDVWTMKYLPKFKWNMLTEQIGKCFGCVYAIYGILMRFTAHEAAIHTAKLRVELSQSRQEQRDYLKNVELARVLEKRAERKREKGEEMELKPLPQPKKRRREDNEEEKKKKPRNEELDSVLSSIF
ncbi:hypothetical protein D9758_007484 [Tetrapyrgos nigripes]|uniref:18S rRNA factor 2 n=1 Tax=Tetrapyrgos nigripes TaxID=182062 RepID=A0A8H5G3H2_9AGAR|nr:hypothetical protein D9758_007484 [Tetrapyrgos nigripes]